VETISIADPRDLPVNHACFTVSPRAALEFDYLFVRSQTRSMADDQCRKLDISLYKRSWPRVRVPCPECEDLMVLRWGDILKPHFAHLPSSGEIERACGGGGESLMHEMAKTLLVTHFNAQRRLKIHYTCKVCERSAQFDVDSVRYPTAKALAEFSLSSNARADVCVVTIPEESPLLVIEVLYSHRSTTSGERASLPWFEISAEDVVAAFRDNLTVVFLEVECKRDDRGPCSHPHCFTYMKIATALGYSFLQAPYQSENHRLKDAAVRGRYRYALDWNQWTVTPDQEDVDLTRKPAMWRELLRRQRCLRCRVDWDTGYYRPFCKTCYSWIRRNEQGNSDTDYEWCDIEYKEKLVLRKKFTWLLQFEESHPGLSCQVCEDTSGGYTWYFGNKRLCDDCLKNWTPDKTSRYLEEARKSSARSHVLSDEECPVEPRLHASCDRTQVDTSVSGSSTDSRPAKNQRLHERAPLLSMFSDH
jgi:hypothetical protein